MNFFKKIANTTRYPLGIEWPLLKKMPLVFVLGTLLLCMPILAVYFSYDGVELLHHQTVHVAIGLLLLFWYFVGVTVLACVIIIIMKGPGYVADGYDLPDKDKKKDNESS